jgi:transposase
VAGAIADVAKAPLAIEAVRRIDAIFAVEREINGLFSEQRHAIRQVRVAPLVTSLQQWIGANDPACRAMPMSPRPRITC